MKDENTGDNILLIVLVVAILIVLEILDLDISRKNFNNGYCPNCNTKYVAVTKYGGSTYYECFNCRKGVWYKSE